MQEATEFLSRFVLDDGLLQVCVGSPGNARWFPMAPTFEAPEEGVLNDVYFGPAQRAREGSEKIDVLGTRVLWADVDDPVYPEPTFPPSAIVFSGHGFHLYWYLEEPVFDTDRIELLNKVLIADVPTADRACWNANRLMRVPMTTNTGKGDEEPTQVELRHTTSIMYSVGDIEVLAVLDDIVRRRIRTGTMQGYHSRSERDWGVIKQLVQAGAEDSLIELLFEEMPIGDKVRDKGTSKQYLAHTIAKVREEHAARPEPKQKTTGTGTGTDDGNPKKATRARAVGAAQAPVSVVEKEDGYYMSGVTSRRVSTFTLTPKVLLDGSAFQSKDAIVCDVHANGYIWPDITFSRGAFTSVSALDKETPVAAWQWLGHDGDVRLLLPYLIDRLRENGLPKLAATPTMGLHMIKGLPYFVGDKTTIGRDAVWSGSEGPIVWLPTNREHPRIFTECGVTPDDMAVVRTLLPMLNEPTPVWTMIGWYAAACLKPWIEAQGLRFPILNVAGTKGSGKTTLIQRVFMPLFGQSDPRSYDAGTTRFVTLALLGGSNAIPVAFSEFRYDAVEKFIRTILMAYDTGHDPRGRSDQSTQDYPMSAPFSVDGEDVITDPAGQERIVLARLRPSTISEGTAAYGAFRALTGNIPRGFGAAHIQACLSRVHDGTATAMLDDAKIMMAQAFPATLPDRVRNNYTVALFGTHLFCTFTGLDVYIDPKLFIESVKDLVNLETGRGRTQVDDFVESVVNGLSGVIPFKATYDAAGKIVWFQLAPAHNWWIRNRRQQGRSALERDAIKTQLREAPYSVDPKVIDATYMHGISLASANEVGLDVPTSLNLKEFKMLF